MFYRFFDVHSGGVAKLDRTVYIEASSYDEAAARFKARFGRDPYNVTCDCCGPDFSVMDVEAHDIPSRHDRGKPLVLLAARR